MSVSHFLGQAPSYLYHTFELLLCQEEIIEVVITALEKFHWENRDIAFWVKAELDKRFGCSWHVVVGEEFGFDITYEVRLRDRGGRETDNCDCRSAT